MDRLFTEQISIFIKKIRLMALLFFIVNSVVITISQYFHFFLVYTLISSNICLGLMFWGIVVLTKRKLQSDWQSITELETWAQNYHNRIFQSDNLPKPPENNLLLSQIIQDLEQARIHATFHHVQYRGSEQMQQQNDLLLNIGDRKFFDHRLEALLSEFKSELIGAIYLIHLKQIDKIVEYESSYEAALWLKSVISLIEQLLGQYPDAIIARHSEHEVSLMVPFITLKEVEQLAEKLLKLLTAVELPQYVNKEGFFHIGVVYFQSEDSLYHILSEADMALRAAQLQGPNNWFMYDPKELNRNMIQGAVRWRTALNNAVSNQDFIAICQPAIIDGDSSKVHHHEILVRMHHTEGKLIPANLFMPMAVKFGLVQQIDRIILERTLALIAYENKNDDKYSLHLHIDSLLNLAFQKMLLEKLEENQTLCQQLYIEIGEYYLHYYQQQLAEFLTQLRHLQIGLIIDQVGYYVLNQEYIYLLDIHYLKLHPSVTHKIHEHKEKQQLIINIKQYIEQKQSHLFAVNVATEAEWYCLQRLGIYAAQGYYFTDPLDVLSKTNSN